MKKGARHLKDEARGILNSTKWGDYFEEISPGVLVWKIAKKNSHMKQGDIAGWIDDRGYCRITWNENGERYTLFRHHIIWVMHNGAIPAGKVINHIKSVDYGDSITNLELVTPDDNNSAFKRVKVNKRNQCGETGVRERKDREGGLKWQARVTVDGKTISLGHFLTKEEAVAARDLFIKTKKLPSKKLNHNCKSFIPGIQLLPNGKFRVENNKGGKRNYIGTFSNFESAASALIEWEVMNGY